jgi:hypothetical protein
VRPSAKSTHKVSSSKRTALAEVLMPRPFDLFASRGNNPAEPRQIATGEAKTIRQCNLWPQPELRLRTGVLDMDMGRLARAAFVGIKEKPRAADTKNNRPCVKLARGRRTVDRDARRGPHTNPAPRSPKGERLAGIEPAPCALAALQFGFQCIPSRRRGALLVKRLQTAL